MLTPKEFADKLAQLYEENFGNQPHGAYQIYRQDLVEITGRPLIHQTVIEDVADWLVLLGLILIDRGDLFIVVRYDYFEQVRKVPEDIIVKHSHPVDYGGPYST